MPSFHMSYGSIFARLPCRRDTPRECRWAISHLVRRVPSAQWIWKSFWQLHFELTYFAYVGRALFTSGHRASSAARLATQPRVDDPRVC